MTIKVFWQDPYLAQLDATITTVNGDAVTVDQTIFYAAAGGQESDGGTIGNYRVLQARKEGKEIFYTLEAGHTLHLGDAAPIVIDWERRYRLMRLHFAAELVLELAYQNLPSITKIGAHIAPDKSRIDFEWSESSASSFPLLQSEANRLIAEDHPIISAFSDEESERRDWKIEGFAQVACGGTHLKHTGEVGPIQLKRKNIGKGKERIEIYLANLNVEI